MRNKNSNIKWRSLDVLKVIFPIHKELLIKEKIRSLWEQIISFKRSSHLRRDVAVEKSLLDTVVSL